MPTVYLKDKNSEVISYEGITEVQLPINSEQSEFNSFYSDELLQDTIQKSYFESGSYTITPEDNAKGFKKAEISIITPDPIISINNSGLITATAGKQITTKQLETEEENTITPSSVQQTAIKQGTYATGNIIVAPIPDDYISKTSQFNTWGRSGAVFATPRSDKFTIYSKVNIDKKNEDIFNNSNIKYIDCLKIFATAENSVVPDLLNSVAESMLANKVNFNQILMDADLYFCGVENTIRIQFGDITEGMGPWEYVIDTIYKAFPRENIDISNYFTNYDNTEATCLNETAYFRCLFPFTFADGTPFFEVEYNVSNVDIDGSTYTVTSANVTQEDSTLIL